MSHLNINSHQYGHARTFAKAARKAAQRHYGKPNVPDGINRYLLALDVATEAFEQAAENAANLMQVEGVTGADWA